MIPSNNAELQKLSREVIALARQGGKTLDELREARHRLSSADGKAGSKDKGGRPQSVGKPGTTKLARPASVPNIGSSGRQGMGSRRGGGWAHEPEDDLQKFREKVDAVLGRRISLDYCEPPLQRTALWEATWKNNEAVVKLLVKKGAKVEVADYQGRTPLHEAAFYGHLSLLEFLLDKGHPLDPVDKFGQTPLFRAVEGGRHEVVRLLVERGARTNTVDYDGVTAQHVAAFRGLPDLSDFLVSQGAFKHRLNIDGALGGGLADAIVCQGSSVKEESASKKKAFAAGGAHVPLRHELRRASSLTRSSSNILGLSA